MDGILEDNMKLKEKAFNHFAALFSLLVVIVLMLAVLAYLEFHPDMVFIFSIFFVLDAAPALYLHIEYYLCNRGEEYGLKPGELIQYKDGEERRFTKEDIERIKVYMAASVYKGSNFHILSIESYHYARIYLKNGEEIIITCLLAPKVEEAIKELNIPYQRKKWLFNTLSWK